MEKERETMLERQGKKYLNGQEACEVLKMAFGTFQEQRKRYGLLGIQFPGKGRQIFYREEAIQFIKESSIDQIEETKQRIAELQAE